MTAGSFPELSLVSSTSDQPRSPGRCRVSPERAGPAFPNCAGALAPCGFPGSGLALYLCSRSRVFLPHLPLPAVSSVCFAMV